MKEVFLPRAPLISRTYMKWIVFSEGRFEIEILKNAAVEVGFLFYI